VLVVCNAHAPAIQRICQDQIAARMLMAWIRPAMATEADLITAQGEQITDKIFAAARREGANAIWAATVTPDFTVVSPDLASAALGPQAAGIGRAVLEAV
jgi:hypothetical protein